MLTRRAILPALMLLVIVAGCATPGLMKRWERVEQSPLESRHFAVYLDDGIDEAVGLEVLDALEFARERVGIACNYYTDDKVICNLYQNEQNLRNICVGLPLGFFMPTRTPLAYVLGGEVHGRLYTTAGGNVSRLWASTFAHEYCHVMFKQVTGRQYFSYSWLQEGLGEYFRQLYLQEKVLTPELDNHTDETFLLAKSKPYDSANPQIYLNSNTNGVWTYTDWEIRDALRYDELPEPRSLSPKTFIGYWQKYNTRKANQIYAISSSLVEYLVNVHGWRKMRALLDGLREDSSLDRVMTSVYGFDQDGLNENWRLYLKQRWPDPWQPNIAMVYLVRGNWEIDGLETGIRTAMAERNIESAKRHRKFLESRRIPLTDSDYMIQASHSQRIGRDPRLRDPIGIDSDPHQNEAPGHSDSDKAPAIIQYEAAMACYSIGRFAEGVDHLKNAIHMEPEQIKYLRIHLARGLWLTDHKEESIKLYREELLASSELPVMNEIAWCFERAGLSGDAARVYQSIAESSDEPGLTEHALRRMDRLKNQDGQTAAAKTPKIALNFD